MSRYKLLIAFCAAFWVLAGCDPTPTPHITPESKIIETPTPIEPGGDNLPACPIPFQNNLVPVSYNHEPNNGLLYIVMDNTDSVQAATQGMCGEASPEEDRRFAPEYVLSLLSHLPQSGRNHLSVRLALIGASKGQNIGFNEILGTTEVSALKMRSEWRTWLKNPPPLESDGGTNYQGIFQKIADDIQSQPNVKLENVTLWVLTDGIGISNKTHIDKTQEILIGLSKQKKVKIEISILCSGALSEKDKEGWKKIAGVGDVNVDYTGNKTQWINNILTTESIRPFLPEKHGWVWPGYKDGHSYQGLSSLNLYKLHWYMLEEDPSSRFQITWAPAFSRLSAGKMGHTEINFLETSASCFAPNLQIKHDTSTSIGFTWLEEIQPKIEMSVDLPANAASINLKHLPFSSHLDFGKSGWTKGDIQSKARCLSLCVHVHDSAQNPNEKILFVYRNNTGDVFRENGFSLSAFLELRPKQNSDQKQSTCFDLGLMNGEEVIALIPNNCIALQSKPSLHSHWDIVNLKDIGDSYTITQPPQTVRADIIEFSFTVRHAPGDNPEGIFSSTSNVDVSELSKAIKGWTLPTSKDTLGCPSNHRPVRWVDESYSDPKAGDYFVCKKQNGQETGTIEYLCKTFSYIIDYCQIRNINFTWQGKDNFLHSQIKCNAGDNRAFNCSDQ